MAGPWRSENFCSAAAMPRTWSSWVQRRENDAHGEDSGMTLKMDGKVEAKVIFFLSNGSDLDFGMERLLMFVW